MLSLNIKSMPSEDAYMQKYKYAPIQKAQIKTNTENTTKEIHTEICVEFEHQTQSLIRSKRSQLTSHKRLENIITNIIIIVTIMITIIAIFISIVIAFSIISISLFFESQL